MSSQWEDSLYDGSSQGRTTNRLQFEEKENILGYVHYEQCDLGTWVYPWHFGSTSLLFVVKYHRRDDHKLY